VVRPLYYAYVDPNRIREVFQNLIDNAIKYTNEGQIAVRLTGDTNTAQIQIQDSGVGIPPEDIPHLFQKFYRVDNSSTRTVGGTGLGLFICKKIVELYNGRIWLESEFNKGSTFFINLPRLNTQQALELQQKQAATISPMDKPI
jgi:signal transduction histidine kinase